MEEEGETYGDLLRKYKTKIASELGDTENAQQQANVSREYQQFRKELESRELTTYEKLCKISGDIFKLKPDKKKEDEINEAISMCHLNVTPTGVFSFSILAPIALAFLGALIFYFIFGSMFFVLFFLMAGVILIGPLGKMPMFIANSWRMKASNQMVLCIFYVVTYMRHTSNLELAIRFAAEHLAPPLSLDLKKVLWDVETEKYESIRTSLETYLETWKKWNLEFIESFHLIEGSLYEGSEERRLELLDKSLDVMLNETYEKMLHYAHNLKGPITMLNMLGVIMPILGLVILPLIVSFMTESPLTKWYIASIYDVAIPVSVYFLGKNILATRPTGYGDTDISEENPELKKYRNLLFKIGGKEVRISPLHLSVVFGVILFMIGISPLLLNAMGMPDIGFGEEDLKSVCQKSFCLLGYEGGSGPFGLGASLLSLAVIISIGVGVGIYFKAKSQNVIKIREKSKELELEFGSALFQLGNRLGDGIPAEMAFGKVAETMTGTASGKFMEIVSSNIQRMGMSVERAIFDPMRGALVYYPSSLIESSMKVLTQSVKKGPSIAAQALINVSRYIKEIHKVNERLKDLMADVISSMQSQIKFLTPAIAGIVIGITSMITMILGKLSKDLASMASAETSTGLIGMFGKGVPTFYFQIIVGLYVVEIVYILTILANGIENGADKLNERYTLGINLTKSTIMYCLISMGVMLLFNMIAVTILNSATG